MRNNKLLFLTIAYSIIGIASVFALVNFTDFIENKILISFFKLHPVTKDGFSSVDNFISFSSVYIKYNKLKSALFLCLFLSPIYFYFRNKKSKEDTDLEKVMREFELVFTEPFVQDKKTGKIITPEVIHMPEIDFSTVNDNYEFIINKVHEKAEKNIIKYHLGILKKLKEMNLIPVEEGVVEPTGFPGQYKFQLISEEYRKKQRLESVFDKAKLYFEEQVGSKRIKRYPKINFLPNGNLEVDVSGVNILKKQIMDSLEILSAEFEDKVFINVTEIKGKSNFYEIHTEKQADLVLMNNRERLIHKLRLYNESSVVGSDISKEFEELIEFIRISQVDFSLGIKLHTIFSNVVDSLDSSFKAKFVLNEQNQLDLMIKFLKDEVQDTNTISDNIELWENEGPISKMRDLWEKEKQFYWYFGELRDSSLTLNTRQIIVSGDNLVHPYLIGTSGSGKTEGLKTVLMTLKHAYGDEVQIFAANGTPSADLDPIVSNYSPMGKEAAKPEGNTEKDKLMKLLNILLHCNEMAIKRGALFKETYETTGKECLKISAYRSITGKSLPEIVVAIDEFAGYSQIINYDTNYTQEGTVAFILQVGFSQWRKYGIHFVIATQEAKAASIPRRLFSNMSGGVVFRIAGGDKSYMESSLQYDFENRNPITFKKGHGLFNGGDIRCETTLSSKIPIAMPYIGKDVMEYIKRVNCSIDSSLKTDYDTDLLVLSEKDLDFSKISLKQLQTIIDKCFLEREGWRITRKENPSFKIIHTYAEDEQSRKIFIAFADVKDILSPNFRERIEREQPEEVDLKVFMVSGVTDGKKLLEAKYAIEEEGESNSLVLAQSDYIMALREAYHLFQNKIPSSEKEIFNTLLSSINNRSKEKNEEKIKELYKNNFHNGSFYLNNLEKIREMGEAAKKGSSFEDFFLAMERGNGYDTVHGLELSLKKIVNLKFANPRAEGGLDAFRFTNREEKRGIAFQLKNQMSKPLDPTIIDKMVKTKRLYEAEGMIFEQFVLISTGKITAQAKMEGEKLGFIMIDGDRLDQIIIGLNQNDEEVKTLGIVNPMGKKEEQKVSVVSEISQKNIEDKKKLLTELIEKAKQENPHLSGKKKIFEIKDIEESIEIDEQAESQVIDTAKKNEPPVVSETVNMIDYIVNKTGSDDPIESYDKIKTKAQLEDLFLKELHRNDPEWYSSDLINFIPDRDDKKKIKSLCSFVKTKDEFVDVVICGVHFTRAWSLDVVDNFNEIEKILSKYELKIRHKEFVYIGTLSKKLNESCGIKLTSKNI